MHDPEKNENSNLEEPISPSAPAPRLTWGVLALIITGVASATGSYVLSNARISNLLEKIEDLDRKGTVALSAHIAQNKDVEAENRIANAELKKDLQAFREFLDYRLGVIEMRLAIPRPSQRPATKGDEVKP